MSTKQPPAAYHLRVKLKFDKRTYRDILIRDDQTFEKLHDIIYSAFDRYDEHLYYFSIKAPHLPVNSDEKEFTALMNSLGFRTPKRQTPSIRISSPQCDLYDENHYDASTTRLKKFKLKAKQKFEYLFDFGDAWWHEIEVRGVVPFEVNAKYPRIIKVNGDSPPQYPDYDEDEL
ncbi:MAG: hypothetical protein PHH77_09975 [Victivallaceae bacterium]|nr:hypothetical protein [Victivallaceae bacterium]